MADEIARARHVDNFTYCTVPASGQDALLFGAVALLIASALQGKLSALWVLIAGAPSEKPLYHVLCGAAEQSNTLRIEGRRPAPCRRGL